MPYRDREDRLAFYRLAYQRRMANESPAIREARLARKRAEYATESPERRARRVVQNRNAKLKRLYGITPEMFDEYLDAQEGACAFCDEELPKQYPQILVEHDHATGLFRGLVHRACNGVIASAERNDNFIGYMDANRIGEVTPA